MDGSGGGYRLEGDRWLAISEKLLVASDLQGARSFAIRARDSDPRHHEYADQIVAVCDTLLASELRTSSNNYEYYAILQIPRLTQSVEVVATHYRKLALLLNPQNNRLLYADQAFKLVAEAWLVLSNPSKKAMYDQDIQVSQFGQVGQVGQPGRADNQFFQTPQRPTPQGFIPPTSVWRSSKASAVEDDHVTQQFVPEPTLPIRQRSQPSFAESSRSAPGTIPVQARPPPKQQRTADPTPPIQARPPPNQRTTADSTPPATAAQTTKSTQASTAEPQVPSFWTACPYCYMLYEYPKKYEECALRCQSCERAFQAVTIPAPPVVTGNERYFCCWGFFPLGFSGNITGKGGFGANWSPFSAMFAAPFQNKPKTIYKDDVYVDLSESSEEESDSGDEWGNNSGKKKAKNTKRRATTSGRNVKKPQNERSRKGNVDGAGGSVQEDAGGRGERIGVKKRTAGKLDLNVMFSNEGEEGVPGTSKRNGPRHREEDNIEGISFFEGLDEFLSTLPILSAVGDDKVKAN